MFGVNPLEWEVQEVRGTISHSEIWGLISFLVSFLSAGMIPQPPGTKRKIRESQKGRGALEQPT